MLGGKWRWGGCSRRCSRLGTSSIRHVMLRLMQFETAECRAEHWWKHRHRVTKSTELSPAWVGDCAMVIYIIFDLLKHHTSLVLQNHITFCDNIETIISKRRLSFHIKHIVPNLNAGWLWIYLRPNELSIIIIFQDMNELFLFRVRMISTPILQS